MKIIRIYNNNVIEAEDKGEELILLGKGLAFGHKVGNEVPIDKVDKVFTKAGEFGGYSLAYIKALAEGIPEQYWLFLSKVMNLIELTIEKKLRTGLYIALLDHLYVAVDRAKKNIRIPNMFGALRGYYPQEYQLAEKIVRLTEEEFDVEFDETETLNVTFHLIDAQMDPSVENVTVMIKTLDDILAIVNRRFKRLDKNSLMYERFIIHLRYFIHRALSDIKYSLKEASTMYQTYRSIYYEENACLQEIKRYMKESLNYEIDDEESFYLLLHIVRAVNY